MYFVISIPPSSLLYVYSKSLEGDSGTLVGVVVFDEEDDEELLEISEEVLVELLDCTEEELESSPHAVSDKTIAAVKTTPKIFCPFFISLLTTRKENVII